MVALLWLFDLHIQQLHSHGSTQWNFIPVFICYFCLSFTIQILTSCFYGCLRMHSVVKSRKYVSLHFILTTFASLWTAVYGIPKDEATPKLQDQGLYPRTAPGVSAEENITGFVIFQA